MLKKWSDYDREIKENQIKWAEHDKKIREEMLKSQIQDAWMRGRVGIPLPEKYAFDSDNLKGGK